MKRHPRVTLCVCALAALLLAGCEGAKKELGLTRTAPDEFAVVKRAPLAMPPDYTLRPPRLGAVRPQEAETDRQAQTVVFGGAQPAAARPAEGESALLHEAGATAVAPGIRETVDRETAVLKPRDRPVAEKLLGWTTGGTQTAPASVVDAPAEAERLRKAVEDGKPVTEGATPTKEE